MIEIKNFSFRFRNEYILKNLNFSVGKGEVVGLFGINGSGKTTLLKSILSLYKVYEGEILVQCDDFIGIIEEPGFSPSFSGSENLSYLLNEKQMKNLSFYVNRFEMESYINNLVKTYSQGMRQKLALVLVFLLNSDLIILDEPLNSLDVKAKSAFKQTVNELKLKGTSFIISSHILDETSSIYDRILLIHNKKIEQIEFDNELYFVTLDCIVNAQKILKLLNKNVISYNNCTLEIKLNVSATEFLEKYSKYGIISFVKSDLTYKISSVLKGTEVYNEI